MRRFTFIALMCIYLPLLAQLIGVKSEYAVPGSQYPRILPDNRVEFKVRAPKASTVQVDLGKTYDMVKDDSGNWACTTEPISQGFQYYFLIIDGTRVADPSSMTFYGCSTEASGIEIPYPDGDTRFYQRDVPRGEIAIRRFYSKTDSAWNRIFVYTPPTYGKSNEKFPVLYIQHGGGEDESGWALQGKSDIILDNLISEGKAVPMVVVMSDGNTRDFTGKLLNEVIPLVESTYRVKTGAENRALAGLSMGGIHTLNTVVEHPENFGYVGVFSSGWFSGNNSFMRNDTDRYYSLLSKRPDFYNKQFRRFWLSMGGKEDIAYNNCQTMMKRFDEIGIKYDYFETPGGHTWPVWRESLYNFAQQLFK